MPLTVRRSGAVLIVISGYVSLFFPELIEGYCRGGGNIQRIDSVIHRYFHGIITAVYSAVGKSVALCSHNNGKLIFRRQSRIIYGKRIILKGHRNGFKAASFYLIKAVII